MITYIWMLWFTKTLHAPMWLYVLLWVGFTLKCMIFIVNLLDQSIKKKGE